MRPPRPARALVRALARADDRASVLGDLDAEFERLALQGPVRDARRWYWRQALMSAGPLLRSRVEGRMRRPTAAGALEDARQGARWVRRHPWLSATVAATLAIALGAALAALAVAEAAVWRPLPYPHPDRIVRVWVTGPTRPAAVRAVSHPDFLDWRAIRSFAELSAYAPASLRLSGRGDPREIEGMRVESGFDRVAGITPALGRMFVEADFTAGGQHVAILQHGFWMREFGGDPRAIGRTVTLDEQPHEIIGVLPASRAPLPLEKHEVWVPLVLRPGVFWEASRATGWLTVIGRLRPGVSTASAEAELTVVAKQLEQTHATTNAGKSAGRVVPLADEIAGPVAPVVALLAAAVGAVLVIACGNITSLLLAARAARRREFAVRAAIGAARTRVVRQVFAEHLILCVVGGCGALALAPWMANSFVSLYPGPLHGAASFGITVQTIAAGALAALVAALVMTVPALISRDHHMRVDMSSRSTSSRADRVLRRSLVALQIALSFVLLVAGAGLVRTVQRLTGLDPGFRAGGVLTFTLSPSRQKYPSAAETLEFYQAVVDAIRSTPGVRSAAAALAVPLTSFAHRFGLQAPGAPVATLVNVNHAMPGYFETLGIPLLSGRLLTAEEHRSGRVAVVNRTLADALRGIGPVPGVRIPYAGEYWQVVGVVEGSRQRELREPPAAEIFLPWRMAGARPQTIVVRADGEPLAVLPLIAARVHDLDPSLPLAKTATLASRLDDARQTEVFRAALVLALAAIASALAALGAYSVTAYAATARAREFGVRLALGERPRSIAARAIWTAAAPSLHGITLGALVAVAAGRWLDAFLYEVKAHDPTTLTMVALLLGGLSLAAAARSAIAAARTDPVNTLRADS